MLYWKLIFRGILRHKKRGLKFFVILAICFMVTIFSLSFKDSFYHEYEKLGVNARTAHITVLSPESVWLKNSFTSLQKDDLPLIKVDDEFNKYMNGLPEVEIGTPVIETGGAFYTKEGKNQSGGTITGVRASDFKKIYPGIVLLKGSDDITVKPDSKTIPMLRWDVQTNEKIKNTDKFVTEDFKVSGNDLESFKSKAVKDFPGIFKDNKYEGTEGTGKFIDALNAALGNKDLYQSVPKTYTEKNNLDIKFIEEQLKTLKFSDESELKNWNKRLIQAVYKDAVNEVPEGFALNKPMGVFVKSTDSTRPPTLIPVNYVGYCEGIPEFYGYNFIELSVIQQYIDVKPEDCTSYIIRLKDVNDLESAKAKVESYIKSKGLNYKVVDYNYLGNKTHMPLATGVTVVFECLIVLFLLISIFFVSYTVKISLIRRRKEMGTIITLGLSRFENAIVFIGENVVIMTVAWAFASVVMGFLLGVLSKNGLGGIVFFPKGILHLSFKPIYFIQAYLLILIPSLLASVVTTLDLRRVNIVDLLKGELSK